MNPLVIKILLGVYGVCLIPTLIAIISWPDAKKNIIPRETYEGKLGSFFFFLSVWIISPVIILAILVNKITSKK